MIPGDVLAQLPAPAQPPPPEKTGYTFIFQEKTVYYHMPEWGVVRGKLNKEGAFIPDPLPAQKPSILAGPVPTLRQHVAINDRRHWYQTNPTTKDLDDPPKVEFVYEYRSGVLIPGQLMEGGYFVPTAGGATIPFADYVPGPMARRIYNLPGEFVPLKR
jgi:hypothetical protein